MFMLKDLLAILDNDMIIHVRNKRIEYSGTVLHAFAELNEKQYSTYRVHQISNYLDGLLIEAYPDNDD